MNKKAMAGLLVAAVALSVSLTACSSQEKKAPEQKPTAETTKPAEKAPEKAPEKKAPEKEASNAAPGDSGFNEIEIGSDIVGPFEVGTVYFQAVDMIPEGKQPSAAESDMHLEADIHLKEEAAKAFGFGSGEEIWPSYLTVTYRVMDAEGKKEITSGVMMPMNADDGAHYGINVKKGVIPVGKYKLVIEIQASQDYLLHVDEETGVPAAKEGKDKAAEYYKKQTVTFDWNYDGSQMVSK